MLPREACAVNKIISLLLILLAFSNSSDILERRKRYLVYEDGGPARVQFIIGFGVPVESQRQAVTVGSVIKFQYHLPINSTEYTTRFYDYAATVSRYLIKDENINATAELENEVDVNVTVGSESNVTEESVSETDVTKKSSSQTDTTQTDIEANTTELSLTDDEEVGNHLVDINFEEESYGNRTKRAITKLKNGLKQQTISLEEAIEIQEKKDLALKQNYQEEPEKFNRWHLYKVLEQLAERHGYSGRPCLLRSICETTDIPFSHHHGLLGEIAHILFTPSTTSDRLTHHSDNEYHAAERLGRESNGRCEDLFPDCEVSLLDAFSRIGVATLSRMK